MNSNRERRIANRYLGIDLGTTFSSVAYIDFPPGTADGKPRFEPKNITLVEPNLSTPYLIPTLVDYGPSSIPDSPMPTIGKRISESNAYIFEEFKLNLGAQAASRHLPNGLIKRNEDAAIDVLKFLKRRTEDALQSSINQVCLAIPPTDYEDYQPDRTELMSRLGQQAGFKSINVIEEPLAAILDIDFENGGILTHEDKTIMVIDYGGGTCDIAIVKASYRKFLWSAPPKPLGLGTAKCGGRFIDDALINWVQNNQPRAIEVFGENGLREASRKLKEKMSRWLKGEQIVDPSTIDGFFFALSKEKFMDISRPIINNMIGAIEQALSQVQRKQPDVPNIHWVFLVGGGSHHPLVESTVQSYFANKGKYGTPEIKRSVTPQLSVSRGAALYNFYDLAGQLPMVDELRQNLYLQFPDGSMKQLARKGQRIPFRSPNCFEVGLTTAIRELDLKLWKKDPKTGIEQVYATRKLEFPEQITDTKIRLDVTVDLRQHVIIKAYTRKRTNPENQLSAEIIVRSPLS